jgi:hypothetical protein
MAPTAGLTPAPLVNWQNCSGQSLLTQPAGLKHSRQHPVPRDCLPSLIADRRAREGRGRSARTGISSPARRHSRRRFRAQSATTRRQMDCRHIRARNGGSAGGIGHRTHRVDKVSNSASTAPISPMGPSGLLWHPAIGRRRRIRLCCRRFRYRSKRRS